MIEPLLGELKPILGLDFVFGSGIVEPHALVCEDESGTEKRARKQNCKNAFHCWVVPSVRKYEEHCGSFKYQHEANPLIYAAAVRASKECPAEIRGRLRIALAVDRDSLSTEFGETARGKRGETI